MKKKYVVGMDIGTQSTRVIIFDQYGTIISEGKQSHQPLYLPGPGMAEHPGDDIWESFQKASRRAMSNYEGDPADLVGVGLTTQRCCRALTDSNGNLLFPMISWLDKRTYVPYQHLDIYKNVKKVLGCSGYLCKKLTGEFHDTVANFVGEWPLDDNAWRWSDDPAVIKHYNIPIDMLPKVFMPGQVVGHITKAAAELTGLPEGMAVIAGAGDKQCEVLGGGAYRDGQAYISCGTYVGCNIVSSVNKADNKTYWSYLAATPHMYTYEGHGVRRGFWTVTWFSKQFGEAVWEKCRDMNLPVEAVFDREAEEIAPGCEGLITIPDWAPPADKQYRKGAMLGFDGRHTRAHMFRSILEGIALSIKNNAQDMSDSAGIQLQNLNIGGGGSNSTVAMQIFADVFGLPIIRTKVYEANSLGSAIDAAVGSGLYANFDEAVGNMVHTRDVFEPNPQNAAFYKELNETVYRSARQNLDPLFQGTHGLVD